MKKTVSALDRAVPEQQRRQSVELKPLQSQQRTFLHHPQPQLLKLTQRHPSPQCRTLLLLHPEMWCSSFQPPTCPPRTTSRCPWSRRSNPTTAAIVCLDLTWPRI